MSRIFVKILLKYRRERILSARKICGKICKNAVGIQIYVRPIKKEILHSIERGFYACSKEKPVLKI